MRLPKKLSGDGGHRGFAFVEFCTKSDARRAMDALKHSTHLYGRRLVLEWAEREDTLEGMQRKVAGRFAGGEGEGHSAKRVKKAKIMEDVLLRSGKE